MQLIEIGHSKRHHETLFVACPEVLALETLSHRRPIVFGGYLAPAWRPRLEQ